MNPTSFLGQISTSQQSELLSLGTIKSYSAGQIIHSRGDAKPGLSIVCKGIVMVGIGGIDGSYLPVTMLGPGETFGEFTLFVDLPRTHDIYATVDASICQISKSQFFLYYQQNPYVCEALLKTSLFRNHQLLEIVDALRRLELPQKVVKMLLFLSKSADSVDKLHCRQTDLAALLGVSRVSLGKVLSQLSKQGLLQLGYGYIRFPSIERCYAWLDETTDTPLGSS